MSDIEPFIIAPEPSPEAHAPAIICGHKIIQDLGVDGMCEFHGFVQEVLATIISPEFERLVALSADSPVICPQCRGERRVNGHLCSRCNGNAQIRRTSLREDEQAPFEAVLRHNGSE